MILGFWSAGGVLWMGVRAWKILDRPLIHANLSQSHSVFFARLHSANRLVFALLSQTLSGMLDSRFGARRVVRRKTR